MLTMLQQRNKEFVTALGAEHAGCHFREDIIGCLEGALAYLSGNRSLPMEKSISVLDGGCCTMARWWRQQVVLIGRTPRIMLELSITSTVITSLGTRLTFGQTRCARRINKTTARRRLTKAPVIIGRPRCWVLLTSGPGTIGMMTSLFIRAA